MSKTEKNNYLVICTCFGAIAILGFDISFKLLDEIGYSNKLCTDVNVILLRTIPLTYSIFERRIDKNALFFIVTNSLLLCWDVIRYLYNFESSEANCYRLFDYPLIDQSIKYMSRFIQCEAFIIFAIITNFKDFKDTNE
jgi:hypothetical protein